LVGGQLVALYVWSNISFLVIFDREKKKMGGVGGKKSHAHCLFVFFLTFVQTYGKIVILMINGSMT